MTSKENLAHLHSLLGATNTKDAIAAYKLLAAKARYAQHLEAQLAEMQAKLTDRERRQLVATLRREGKLTSHMAHAALKMDLDALRTWASEAAPIPQLVADDVIEPDGPSTLHATWRGKRYSELTSSERHDLYSADPELFHNMRNSDAR